VTSSYEVQARAVDRAVVRPPGSKSITNRAMVVAALAPGESTLVAPLRSDDTDAMRECLESMGVRVAEADRGLAIRSTGFLRAAGALDARASGTTARFMAAVATLADGTSVVDGTARMRERPIGDLVDVLRSLGCVVEYAGEEGFPPVQIDGPRLLGGRAAIDVTRSSQFASAVLLVAPRAEQPVILEVGETVVSRPYLDTTMEVMRQFGGHADWQGDSTIRVEASGYRPAELLIEADASAAVYPWAIAAIGGCQVTVAGIDPASTQADMGALEVLEAMGCVVDWTPDGIRVAGPDELQGVELDMNDCPDAVLGLSVVAAFAGTPTTFTNIANLRIKETDRLAALENELTKLGAGVETGPDWIRIEPGPTRPATIATYDDHRMAMAFATAGIRQPGIVIENPECVAKTWPEFFEMLESL